MSPQAIECRIHLILLNSNHIQGHYTFTGEKVVLEYISQQGPPHFLLSNFLISISHHQLHSLSFYSYQYIFTTTVFIFITMLSINSIPLLCCKIILLSAYQLSLAYENPRGQFCDETTYYAPNSTFSSNLNLALETLAENTASTGFATTTVGDVNQTVTALALCRATIDQSNCQLCVEAAASGIRSACPNQTVSEVWYTLCMLRYSYDDFLNKADNSIHFTLVDGRQAPDSDAYDVKVSMLMRNLSSTAGASEKRYAVGRTAIPENLTVYGYVDCTRDIDGDSCSRCLLAATRNIKFCCLGRWAAWIATPTCNIQFDMDPVHDDWFNGPPYVDTDTDTTPPSSQALPPTTANDGGGGGGLTIKIAVTLTVGIVVLAAAVMGVSVMRRKRERVKKGDSGIGEEDSDEEEAMREKIGTRNFVYDFDVLVTATDNFCLLNRLGVGGFGTVYKVLCWY